MLPKVLFLYMLYMRCCSSRYNSEVLSLLLYFKNGAAKRLQINTLEHSDRIQCRWNFMSINSYSMHYMRDSFCLGTQETSSGFWKIPLDLSTWESCSLTLHWDVSPHYDINLLIGGRTHNVLAQGRPAPTKLLKIGHNIRGINIVQCTVPCQFFNKDNHLQISSIPPHLIH